MTDTNLFVNIEVASPTSKMKLQVAGMQRLTCSPEARAAIDSAVSKYYPVPERIAKRKADGAEFVIAATNRAVAIMKDTGWITNVHPVANPVAGQSDWHEFDFDEKAFRAALVSFLAAEVAIDASKFAAQPMPVKAKASASQGAVGIAF